MRTEQGLAQSQHAHTHTHTHRNIYTHLHTQRNFPTNCIIFLKRIPIQNELDFYAFVCLYHCMSVKSCLSLGQSCIYLTPTPPHLELLPASVYMCVTVSCQREKVAQIMFVQDDFYLTSNWLWYIFVHTYTIYICIHIENDLCMPVKCLLLQNHFLFIIFINVYEKCRS